MAEKLSRLINDKTLRQQISKNNLQKANEYSWDNIIDELEGIYLTAIDID
jgi:glycosyltransferase involved in cell wall biosynthesis